MTLNLLKPGKYRIRFLRNFPPEIGILPPGFGVTYATNNGEARPVKAEGLMTPDAGKQNVCTINIQVTSYDCTLIII
jgi:hypothetical protein